MFHADPREVAISVIACDVAHEILEASCSLERVEVVHFKSAYDFWSKEDIARDVSVDAHLIQSCAYYGTLDRLALVQ
jgi:hypothetical protein